MMKRTLLITACIICIISQADAFKYTYTVTNYYPDYIIYVKLEPVLNESTIEKWNVVFWIHWDFQLNASGCTDCSWLKTNTDIMQFSPRNRCYDANSIWDADYRDTWTIEADDFLHAQQIMFSKSGEMLKRMATLGKLATIDYDTIVFTNKDGVQLIDLTDGNIPIGGY